MRSLTGACLAALLVAATAPSLHAQTFTGGVRGTVHDPNGVIPGVTVTLINEGTNVSREAVTNDVGQYNFPALPPATYTLKAQLTGYKTYESKGLKVGTQEFLTVDVLLQVGAIAESITVTGQAPLIETSNASTGGVLDKQALDTLPSPGRNAFLIGVTVPSMQTVGDPQFNRQEDQTNASRVSLGGGGIRANNYLIDGVPVTELRGRSVFNPIIESVEEVKVQVHTYDAEMGRTGGGVFNTTMKSGTNEFHGSGFYQTRPDPLLTDNFFSRKAGLSKDESGLNGQSYKLVGGGGGGPIVKDRAFFWFAGEGYNDSSTRNLQELWPSLNQRKGDFSRSTIGGQPVVIYNPYCRGGVANAKCPATGTGSIATGGLFTDAIIPLTHPAVNPVGLAILNAYPTSVLNGSLNGNEDNNPNAIGVSPIAATARQFATKGEVKLTDRWSITGDYIYGKSDEPGSTIFPSGSLFLAGDQGEFFGPLRRRNHVVVINNTNVLNDTTVLTLRYGFSTWKDSCDSQLFSPGLQALGFSSNFTSAIDPEGQKVFPSVSFDNVTGGGGNGGFPLRWRQPWDFNGTVTKLIGSHSIKFGAEARKLEQQVGTESALSGSYAFDRLFTSNNGVGGHELASLLLGVPASGNVPATRGRGDWFTKYYSGYIQDDWRATSRFTLNYGLRLEHEDGLKEVNNRQTVGFDRNVTNPIDALVPKTGLLAGKTLKGAVLFAGVNGARRHQGNPQTIKPAPRVGATFSLDDHTVLHGGFGLFWAPWNYSTTDHGQFPFTGTTFVNQTSGEREVPLTALDNPFPGGITPPIGSSLGPLTGVGSTIDVVDQNKGNPKVYQYSADIQRELPGGMAVTIGYVGATGRDIGFGGTNSAAININQVDPNVARQLFPAPGGGWDAAALRASVPNPFFGVAGAGELGTRPTVQQFQLLRPFPEFQDILLREVTKGGRRQYNALEVILDKRTGTNGWRRLGGRFSYTYSRTNDNQFCESSTFATRTCTPQNNFDLNAEYGRSIFDVPHSIVLAPIALLPGPDKTHPVLRELLGGWTVSSIVTLTSGAPLNAVLSAGTSNANLALGGNVRQRPNLIGDPNTSGSDDDRVATAVNPDAKFFNAGAFANPGPGQFGNSPRNIAGARYQFRKNVDLVIAKHIDLGLGGPEGEVRFEALNLTNTTKFRGINSNAVNVSNFGRITSQAGFERIWQLSFRYRF